jgi:F-type H+-transporting ATPase subunit b
MLSQPDRRILAGLAVPLAAGALLLTAAPALASEGGLQIYPDSRFLYLLVGFAILIPIVDVLLFRPIFRVLDERHERIEGAKARADEVQRRASELVQRFELAVQQARAGAEAERQQLLERERRDHATRVASEREEAERSLATARREVARAVTDARQFLRRDAESLAREAAARVLGRSLS